LVRGHSAWALGQLGVRSVVTALQRRATVEEDRSVGGEIDHAILQLLGAEQTAPSS
jgi:hypothetical protein